MVRIQLRLKALSPVAFSARRGTSNFVDTLDYVPGSALRGATAARYLSEIGEAADERFQAIFVKGEASFGNLYPVRYGLRSSVIPLTALSCKAFEGFRSIADHNKHGVFDTLMLAASAQSSQDFSLLEEIADCSQCGQPTHRFSGFYEEPLVSASNADATDSRVYSKVDLNKRHLTHVGINRTSQSAEPEFLYAQQIVSECWQDTVRSEFKPQVFSGELLVSDTHAGYIRDALLERGATLRLGESRSRGLGRMEVENVATVESDTEATIRERMLEFNKRLADRTRLSSGVEYIVLTLQSDAILADSLMRNKTTMDGEILSHAFRCQKDLGPYISTAFRLVYANAEKKLVQSWNNASGYPKPDAVAVGMGSVFLFEVTSGGPENLAKSLAELQELGVGERRSEGFGRLSVCNYFHWEVAEYGKSSG